MTNKGKTTSTEAIEKRHAQIADLVGNEGVDALARREDWLSFYLHDVRVLLDEIARLKYEVKDSPDRG